MTSTATASRSSLLPTIRERRQEQLGHCLHPAIRERQAWTSKEIDRVPTSHRLRWADLFGTGKKVLVNCRPYCGQQPNRRIRGRDPALTSTTRRTGSGSRSPSQNRGVVHGILITDWNDDKHEDVLTASFIGIDAHEWHGKWKREHISDGALGPMAEKRVERRRHWPVGEEALSRGGRALAREHRRCLHGRCSAK